MVFERKDIKLKDGRTAVLRPVETGDAEALIDFLRQVSGETPFLLRNADEVTCTVADEKRLLEGKRNHPKEIMMVVEIDGQIAGNCGIVSRGSLRRICHRCGFAIAIREAYWGLGFGSAMMEYAFSLAAGMGYEQVELEVVEGNERAKKLYERFGFRPVGVIFRSLRYDDGSYRDECAMVKLLKEN